jgi:hypothetical protein
MEPPNESGANPNQLELHATESPRQVRLQKEVFQAVKALPGNVSPGHAPFFEEDAD